MIIEISLRAIGGVLLIGTFVLTQVSCKSGQTTTDNNAAPELAVLTTPPFSTREPQRYQALRTITSNGKAMGDPVVTKTLIARDGNLRREEYESPGGQKIVFLDTPQGKFVLVPAAKLFADMTDNLRVDEAFSLGELSADFLLNQTPTETRYERLGPETVGGRGATKYRVLTRLVGTNKTPDTQTLIWIDDQLAIPVRWETTSSSDATGVMSKMELSDIRLDVEPTAFRLPADYRKVALNALYSATGSSGFAEKSSGEKK